MQQLRSDFGRYATEAFIVTDRRPIVFDCDCVLLDWLGQFATYMWYMTGRLPYGLPDDWEMSTWLGVSPEETQFMIKEFNSSEWFEDIPAIEGAVETVRKLAESGRELHVVTSCSSDPKVVKARIRNLVSVFGDVFEDIVCLDLGESKKEALSKFGSDFIFVEDNYKNALIGHDLGAKVFVLSYPHNMEYKAEGEAKGIVWFDAWNEIEL